MLALGAASVFILVLVTAFVISGPMSAGGSVPASPVGAPTSATAAPPTTGGTGPARSVITLSDPATVAKPFQDVPIRGTHPAGAHTLLRIERREGNTWVAFPVPTVTDESGRFTTYVELGEAGRYWLRVVEPGSGASSEPFLLVIKA